jgi:hypothetical protein
MADDYPTAIAPSQLELFGVVGLKCTWWQRKSKVTKWDADRGSDYAHADHHALVMPAAPPRRPGSHPVLPATRGQAVTFRTRAIVLTYRSRRKIAAAR